MKTRQNAPPIKVGPRPGQHSRSGDHDNLISSITSANTPHRNVISGQQVSWWDVRQFVAPLLDEAVASWPMAGTPEWCALDPHDPRKWCALLDGAQHRALRVETCQQARAAASRDVSAAADWPAIANQIRRRREVYMPRAVAS